ncbi:MAG: hypothetical protein CMN30_31860 [Sandaracinus sp.]|nr:hypothetical protein [Sandaracinus sp.]
MSRCIDKLPHSCGTRKGLQVFVDEESGKVNGWCFNCQTFIANPYGEERHVDDLDLPPPKTEEEIEEEIGLISGYPTVTTLSRKLRAEDLEVFGIKTALSEHDGKTPTHMYFPMTKKGKITGYYVKTLTEPKHTWSVGDVKEADLFGWEKAKQSGAYRLIITEGLEDAVSVDKIYRRGNKNPDYQPAIVSIPNGVGSVSRVLGHHAQDIRRKFKEIVLCFDDDDTGDKAVKEAMLILPEALSVKLPCKDANACVMEGRMQAAYKALAFQSFKPKNTRIIMGEELHEAAREPTPFGELTWPFPTLNKLLRGIRYGETVYIGAGVKMGKSELLNHIAAWFIQEHKVPVFMAKPEEANKKTYKQLCNKIAESVFTDPEVEFDYQAYDEAGEQLKGKLMMVDMYQHMDWATLKADIRDAASRGAKAIFIDPITNLTNGMNPGDANTKLQEIAQDLSSLALDLNVVVFIFCHLKAPDGAISHEARAKKYDKGEYVGLGSCPHELGGDIVSSQFAGSRAMMRSCNLMIGLEGNKDPALPEGVRRQRWLSITEDREFGNTAKVPIYWNPKTTKYKEV